MAISTIGTDALASAAVTSAKLASGAPSRSQLPAGTVLQVVQSTTRSGASTTSNTYVSTGLLSSAVTPTTATSKVLVTCNFSWACSTADFGYFSLGVNGAADGNTEIVVFNQSSTNATNSLYYSTISYLYSPGTTSTQTYTLWFRCGAGPVQTMYFNQRGIGGASGLCTLTAMEIAA